MGITLFAFETKKNITKNAPMETTIVASIPFKGIGERMKKLYSIRELQQSYPLTEKS